MNRYLKKLLLWTAVFLIGLNLLGFAKLNILAKEPDTPSYTRYYKSVLIHRGDSLWKIAQTILSGRRHVSEKVYGGIETD